MAFKHYLEEEDDKPYFTTNSLGYYYDKMEGFAEKVEQAAKTLNVTKEEVEKNIAAYIEQNKNELDQRLAQWDGKLETFDSSVETLLSEWVDDGTLTPLIDSTLIDQRLAPISLQLADKATKGEVENKIAQIGDAKPSGVYATLTALQTAYPTGNGKNIYLISADGKWYYWNGSAWTAGGVYQSTGIADKTITYNKTAFLELTYENFVDLTKLSEGYINDAGIFAANTAVYTTDFIPFEHNQTAIAKIANGGSWGSHYYSANKSPIKRITLAADGSFTADDPNIKFVRLVFFPKPTDNFLMMMVNGNIYPTEYIPHELRLKTTDVLFENLIGEVVKEKSFQDIEELAKRLDPLNGLKGNALGDSITFGMSTTKTYHAWIADRTGMQFANYGISGTTIATRTGRTDSMVERYATMNNDADIITVFGGVNDSNNSVPLGTMASRDNATFYGACHNLFSGLINKYLGKRIGVITPMEYAKKEYVDVLKEVAHYYNLPVLDLYNESGLTNKVLAMREQYIPDTLHPNEKGHEVISRRIEWFIKSL